MKFSQIGLGALNILGFNLITGETLTDFTLNMYLVLESKEFESRRTKN